MVQFVGQKVEIERFGQAKLDWLKTFLQLPNGVPSHDTFGRVFGAMDVKAFQTAFRNWVEGVSTVQRWAKFHL